MRFFEGYVDCATIVCEDEEGRLLHIITDPWVIDAEHTPKISPSLDIPGERNVRLSLLPLVAQ